MQSYRGTEDRGLILINPGGVVLAMWDRLPACPGCKVGGQNPCASPGRSPRSPSERTHAVIVCIASIRDRLEAYPTLLAAFAHTSTSSRNANVLSMRLPCLLGLTAGTAVPRRACRARENSFQPQHRVAYRAP